ncbi:DotU superfamily type VI secretion N-terminal domain protein (plasmid) [Candidatus Trichorickettsia mobilis]|uniref:type IVB secretion system protein IcmH/DotU n=1 Tax=Candidatus Trichorickettsia mobilis TaxID=1346319 RepID=UPI002B26299A|nr:type IVB secretion system protein IcmH/DotU [Candidatus Trichorickettsia mobilis]WPY01674.1 DotU superfamily type VI secretion N-terminal domain protein [Candidatus Trichorickettsia mobilis]
MDKSIITIEPIRELLYIITLLRQEKYDIKFIALPSVFAKRIDQFTELLAQTLPMIKIDQLKYLICAAFDEAYGIHHSTNLNNDHSQSLISYYYHEELSGENFFQILEQLSKDAIENMQILELGYHIINLGFLGMYAIKENGKEELNAIKIKIYSLFPKPIIKTLPLFINDISCPEKTESRTKLIAVFLSLVIVVGLSYWLFNQELKEKFDRFYKLIEQSDNV